MPILHFFSASNPPNIAKIINARCSSKKKFANSLLAIYIAVAGFLNFSGYAEKVNLVPDIFKINASGISLSTCITADRPVQ